MAVTAEERLCSGCRLCEAVCSLRREGKVRGRKAAIRVRLDRSLMRYRVSLCNQCGECAHACPAGAITESGGVYRIDAEACTGCLQCVEACPVGALFPDPEGLAPIKCDACGECASWCPRGILKIL